MLTAKFETSSYGTRSGFNHECTITTSEGRTAHAICHYINRTWEAYPFQSVKRSAVGLLVSQEVEEDCANYKRTHRCKGRLPRGYRKECEKLYRAKYKEIYDHISVERW